MRRWPLILVILFAVLAIAMGLWVFALAVEVVWFGIELLFWAFVALFVLSFLGWLWFRMRSPRT